MILDGFNLEVLVNSSILREYREPAYSYKSSTGPSYVYIRGKSKKFESPDNFYVAVPEVESRFSLRFGSAIATLANPIVVEIYVDGNHDFTYDCLVGPVQAERDGFWNATRDKKAYFKFSKTRWTNDEINSSDPIDNYTNNNTPKKGGIGAITLIFYLAKRVRIKNEAPFKFTLEKVAIPESKENKGIEFSTEFEEGPESPPSDIKEGECSMKPVDDNPIAVLNIHYRPMNWLIACGITELKIYPDISTDDIIDIKDFQPLPLTKKDDSVNSIKVEEDVVFVKDKDSKSESSSLSSLVKDNIKKEENQALRKRKDSYVIIDLTVPNKKVKQKYQETIIILDSDNE
ncbi:7778_t:CDS:2 [Ambispora gerdemannii]|uniref:7778_t:CDS:1 n=1 Tax=Ambispora gerdemannii TaxID=144530 RepID=A0A9N8UVD7_9GLOM|nr:7778_t:CDS:2 [Ambispora gerdemannii]